MTRTTARSIFGIPPAALAALVALVACGQCVTAVKECTEIKPGKLKRLAADHHVLLKVDKKFPSGENEDHYKDLCNRYKETPLERSRDLNIVHFAIETYGDDDAKKKAMEVAKKFGADNEDEWPTYVLLKKGTTDASDAMKYDGERNVEGLTSFLRDELDVKIGTLLYYIDTLDRMASRFMGVDEYGDKKAQLERYFYGYLAKMMIFLYRGEAKEVANQYGKVFTNILKEGNGYASKTKDRLDGMLKSTDNTMSNAKKEEVAQRMHILEKFTDPVEVTDEQNRSFLFSVAWNVLLLVAMFGLSISMLFFDEKDSGKEASDEAKGEESSDDKEDSEGMDAVEKDTDAKKEE